MQGLFGRVDTDIFRIKLTQEAIELNAINVAVKRDSTIKIFTPSHLLRGYILLKGGYDNHSNFKDIQTLEVLKRYMDRDR